MYGETSVAAPPALTIPSPRASFIYWAPCVWSSAPYRPASRVADVRPLTRLKYDTMLRPLYSYSTYSFEPINALINHHRIDSILPEPHNSSLDLLRRALHAAAGTSMAGHYTPLSIQHHRS